ncbi:MAG: Phenylalanine--tRNA ligase beta subunit [Firmicutes bacterium ADurb.BinA052]|nr:MAG: Phenylalanine--tRNA ligase beta subunit [Firmicutes bacterium ADurb.BinA052]
MRVPLRWLREYVDIELEPEQLADALTMSGTKVESIDRVGGGLKRVTSGRVVSVVPHPESGRLLVVELDIGPRQAPKRVVTAATNVAEGCVVPVVLAGGSLVDGEEIGEMEFEGVRSEGMLLSARELGISEDGSGILLLPDSVKPGDDIVESLGLCDDVLELEITPNRPDCLCMSGVARELAAITRKPLRMPMAACVEVTQPARDMINVVIEAPDLCYRYCARVIRRVRSRQSPIWMQARLAAAGVRPISAVVDVTNYVMLELNQPLHAFDYDKVAQRTIIVRRAREDERLVTLDGAERELNSDMLMIADSERALAVAGVMGGVASEITEKTETVLLESACFARQSVWRTSRTLKLRTEASSRFEKGLDPVAAPPALDRAAGLLAQMGAGEACSGIVEVYPSPQAPAVVETTDRWIERRLGAGIGADRIADCLTRLGFGVCTQGVPDGATRMIVSVPSFRGDVRQPVDLVEEVARVWGYNEVPAAIPEGTLPGGYSDEYAFFERVREALVGAGGTEALTFPFMSEADLGMMGFAPDDSRRMAVRVANPLAEEQSLMRTTMYPAMLAALRTNVNRRRRGVFLFEIGRTYSPTDAVRLGVEPARGETPALERSVLAGVMSGVGDGGTWYAPERRYDFYDAKGAVEGLCARLHIDGVTFSRAECPPFHPGRTAAVVRDGVRLGTVGQVHPLVAGSYQVPEATMLFELDMALLMEAAQSPREYAPLPKYPAVERDIAVVLGRDVASCDVERAIRRAGGALVESVRLFDVYEGPQVGEGRRSLAFSITYQAADRTLTDAEVNEVHDAVRASLARELFAVLR